MERQYLAGDLGQARDPRVSPLFADSHAGLARPVIGIGHHDPLHAQNIAYAQALGAAGVPVVLREYPGTWSTDSSEWAQSQPAPSTPPISSARTCGRS